MVTLLLAGALLTQTSSTSSASRPEVGGFVLMTDGAALPYGAPRAVPALTDAQGHPVSRSPWLNGAHQNPGARLLS